MKITKEDIKTYWKYGPMEFDINKATILYYLIDLPIDIIVYWFIYFIRKVI